MKTVVEVIKWLEQFPATARVHGEIVGIVVTDVTVTPHQELGYLETTTDD